MNGLEEAARKTSAAILQIILASEYVLGVKTRNFHWNVKDDKFMMLHKLFGKQYTAINDLADEVAERIRQIDHMPNGTMSQFIKASFIEESEKVPDYKGILNILVADHEKIVEVMRGAIPKTEANKDFGTMDSLTKWMQYHEKQLYFLRSHLG